MDPIKLDENLAKDAVLSIVIAAHNEKDEVRATCKSALALQGEVGDLEVIVVDDASTDKCCTELPKEVAVYRNKTKQGCGTSHNLGASKARGNVVVFPDAHERFPAGVFRDLSAACLMNKAMACAGVQHIEKPTGCQGYGADFRFHRNGRLGVKYFRPLPNPSPAGFAYKVGMPFGGCYAFNKEFFDAVGGWMDLASIWGYCEQPMGVLAFIMGVEVWAVSDVVKHLYRKINPAGATAADVWKNVAYSHGLVFEEGTNKRYWNPIIARNIGMDVIKQIYAGDGFKERRNTIQRMRKRSDADFFKEMMGVRPVIHNESVVEILTSSVIMPAYNEGAEVVQTLRSLGRAAKCDPEFIIVDDCSTDGSCERNQGGKQVFSDSIRILRSNKRQGVCGSRLVGTAAAKQDIFQFFDAHSRARDGDMDRLVEAAWDTKGFVAATISGYNDKKPPDFKKALYGGYFTVKPKWGLRLDYYTQKPEEALTRITGPIGSCYAVRRDVLKMLRGWSPLPGAWAYSEQAIGLKAYNLGVPIYNLSTVWIHHKMKSGTIDVPMVDVLLNAHFVHRAYFDEDTYRDVWRPILLEHGFDPKIDQMLKSKILKDECEWFQSVRKRTDEEFFRHVLGAKIETMLKVDTKNGTAMPTTQAAYLAYEGRRSPGREWSADRPRMIQHIQDLLTHLGGNHLGKYIHLDLGSRDGWILDHMVKRGFKPGQVRGMELCPWTAKHARSKGRDVKTGDVHDLSMWKDGTFNLVTIIHCLEHCHTPSKVLTEVYRVMRPGGVLMVIVPLEPEGISIKGDHCHAMRGTGQVQKLLAKAGFRTQEGPLRSSGYVIFGEK